MSSTNRLHLICLRKPWDHSSLRLLKISLTTDSIKLLSGSWRLWRHEKSTWSPRYNIRIELRLQVLWRSLATSKLSYLVTFPVFQRLFKYWVSLSKNTSKCAQQNSKMNTQEAMELYKLSLKVLKKAQKQRPQDKKRWYELSTVNMLRA